MKIAIIGAGAIGSVAAAYLTKSGQDVTLIGKEDQVRAVKRNSGIKVQGVRGTETIPIKIEPSLNRSYDLVIFTVKTQDIDQAVQANRDYLENCLILSSQNGVKADEYLKREVPQGKIYSSIVMFGATYTNPAEVTFNFEGDWIIGNPSGPVDANVKTIAGILTTAFPTVISEDIVGMKWLKLFVNFNNCIPALVGLPMQKAFADLDLCRLSILLLKEGLEVIHGAGIKLVSLPNFPKERILGLAGMPLDQAAGIINKTLTGLSKEPLYGSILQSIMRGRDSEIDFINGEVVELAEKRKMDAPLNRKVVELVHEIEKTKKYFDINEIKEIFQLSLKKA